MHLLLCAWTVLPKLRAEQPGWKVILCYSEDEQVNKLIFFPDHGKSSSPFVWFLKMYWPSCWVQLESFLCVAHLKTSHSALSAHSHSRHVFDFCDQSLILLKLLYVAVGSTPYWLCSHTLRRTHTYWASPLLSDILTMLPQPLLLTPLV